MPACTHAHTITANLIPPSFIQFHSHFFLFIMICSAKFHKSGLRVCQCVHLRFSSKMHELEVGVNLLKITASHSCAWASAGQNYLFPIKSSACEITPSVRRNRFDMLPPNSENWHTVKLLLWKHVRQSFSHGSLMQRCEENASLTSSDLRLKPDLCPHQENFIMM